MDFITAKLQNEEVACFPFFIEENFNNGSLEIFPVQNNIFKKNSYEDFASFVEDIEKHLVEQNIKYDKLIIEVWMQENEYKGHILGGPKKLVEFDLLKKDNFKEMDKMFLAKNR